MAALLSCVESELSKTSDLFRQAGLEETFQRVSQVCASLRTKMQDAENKQLFDMQLKRWMEHIVDVCYDMMYVLDELNLQEAGPVRVFSHRFSFFSHHKGIYSLGVRHKLGEIVSRFETLAEEANLFGIFDSLKNWDESSELRQLAFSLRGYVGGREEEKEILVRKLLDNDGDAEEEDIRFISIVGIAGIGKTTLALLVFNDDRVNAACYRAWVSVSEEFNLRKIVMAILGFSTSDLMNDVEMEFLILEFRRVTAGKRCLIVLDDIDNENFERWQVIKEFFNFCVAGSMILITTRKNSVADLASASKNVIHLRALTERESWVMIERTAFGPSSNPNFGDTGLEMMSKKIVNRCRGVPLFLRSLAAIMRYKRSEIEVREILESRIWEVAHENQMGPLLMLFYSQLPSYLKQCLLYCSIFPKDHVIVTDKLIQLWIAQGFIHSDDLEEEGRRIFNGLLGYSIFNGFIQHGTPGSTWQLEGGISGLSHAIAANEYHRMLIDSGKKPIEEHDVPRNCRHCTLTIAPHTCLPESIPNAEKFHTLMILSEYSSVDATNLSQLLSNLRRVRALILSSCSIQELPAKVGKLCHLRYLDLSFNHDLKRLPGVICNLINLQTLNLNGCRSLQKLPKGIGKLIKLRHLEILWTTV